MHGDGSTAMCMWFRTLSVEHHDPQKKALHVYMYIVLSQHLSATRVTAACKLVL